jgi:hypothetical protein
MIRQPQTRQPDETICFSCGTTVKRSFDNCPNCGSRIAAGPSHATPTLQSAPADRAWENLPAGATGTAGDAGEDVVGAGRYILNFILAGLLGLGLTYFLRRSGWLATYICIPIFILGVLYLSTR